ncbi:zf-CCHC domain-containing protein [Tanacetum coccineum]
MDRLPPITDLHYHAQTSDWTNVLGYYCRKASDEDRRQPREEKKSFRYRDEKKGKSDRKCFRCGDPNHLIGDCPKPPRNKDQKAFIGGSWSDIENDAKDKTNNETCLMAQSSNEVTLNSSYYGDNASSLDNDTMQIEYDSLCEISLKIINKNKTLKTKRDLLELDVLELNEKIKKLERIKEIDIALTPIVDSAAQCENGGVTDCYQDLKVIMVNIFPPDHVNDLPEVEPNQPKPALVDENEEPEEEEEEFEDEEEFEEEEPQEEEEDMEVDIDSIVYDISGSFIPNEERIGKSEVGLNNND